MDDDNKPVPTEPEETKPTEDAPPVVTPPAQADDSIRETVSALASKVEELTGLVTGVIATGGGQQDSNPAGKPWTHWGGRKDK